MAAHLQHFAYLFGRDHPRQGLAEEVQVEDDLARLPMAELLEMAIRPDRLGLLGREGDRDYLEGCGLLHSRREPSKELRGPLIMDFPALYDTDLFHSPPLPCVAGPVPERAGVRHEVRRLFGERTGSVVV